MPTVSYVFKKDRIYISNKGVLHIDDTSGIVFDDSLVRSY